MRLVSMATCSGGFEEDLSDSLHELALHQSVSVPARSRKGRNPSLLDLVLCWYVNYAFELSSYLPLIKSDHMVLKLRVIQQMSHPTPTAYRSYSRMDPVMVLHQATSMVGDVIRILQCK